MAKYSFEQITGEENPFPFQPEQTPNDNFPAERYTPSSKKYSFNEITGTDEGSPEAIAKGKTEDDFTAPEYLANKAKLGMATLLSLGGIPLDFIYTLQNYSVDLFDDMVGNEREFDRVDRTLPYGFEAQRDAYEKILFGDFSQKTDDLELRVAGTIAEFAGGSLIPGGAFVSSAAKGKKLATAGVEIGSVVGGGLGAEAGGFAGEGIDPSMRATGEVIGTFAGGMSPYYLPQTLSKSYNSIRRFFSEDFQRVHGKKKAVELIKKELGDVPAAMDDLKRSEQLRENIPGYSPSLGMETDSAGIKSLEKRFAAETTVGHEKAVQAERLSLQAIEEKFQEMFPNSPTGNNLTVVPEERLSKVRESIKGDIAKIDGKIAELDAAVKTTDPELIGKQLRVLRNEREVLARSIKNSNYEEFYRVAEDANITVEAGTIKNMAQEILGDVGQTFQSKSPALNEIVNRYVFNKIDENQLVNPRGVPIAQVDNDITIREFHSMMKRINRDMGIAYQGMQRGDGNAGALYYQLNQLHRKFGENLDVLKNSEFGVVADKLKIADDFYRNEYQSVFRQGVGGRMDNMNRFGDITPDEKIVSDLVMGRGSGVDDFYKIYGESQEAQTLLENGVMDMFARKVMVGGEYKPSAAIDFFKNNDVTLSKMPDLRAKLSDRVEARQMLANRQKVLNQKVKATHKARLEKITGLYNADDVVAKAISDPRDLQSLKRSVETSDDPNALLSFRHGVARHVLKQKDPFEYFLQNEDAMKVAYKEAPAHFKSLKELSEARRVISRKFKGQQVQTSLQAEDPLKKAIGTSAVEAMTMARWVNAGRLSPEYVISQMTSRGVLKFRQAEMNKVMEEALYDPGVARMLLETAEEGVRTGKTWSGFVDGFNEAMYKIGVKAVIAGSPEPKDDLYEN